MQDLIEKGFGWHALEHGTEIVLVEIEPRMKLTVPQRTSM